MENCIFCKILNKQIPSEFVYEDEYCFAINDINPKANKHILVIPKEHIESLNEIKDTEIIKKLFEAIFKINEKLGIKAYQTHINTGKDAGQEVMHLHIHILAN